MTRTQKRAKPKLYKWNGRGFRVPAQVVGEELARLFPNGNVPKEEYVKAASDPSSVLHPTLTWDNDVCGEKYRLIESQAILRSIIVVKGVGESRKREYCYIHVKDMDGPRYVEADRVASDEELRQAAIDELLTHLEGLRKKYNFLSEMRPVFDAAEQVKKRLKKTKK